MMRLQKLQIFSLLTLFGMTQPLLAEEDSEKDTYKPLGIYIGGFGGWGFFSVDVTQTGTAFLPSESGGALYVDATGKSSYTSLGFGGGHIGYEWSDQNFKDWTFSPAIELEGYYFATTQTTNVENSSIRLDLHEFTDSFPLRVGVIIVDGVLALTNYSVNPYIGAGIGAGIVSIRGADSLQTDPPEPGVNHFNSDPNASDSTFAAQVKAGLRFPIFKYMRFFVEYRFLYFSPTNYTFGATEYPDHVPTTNWDVRFNNIFYNLFSAGIDFTF